MPRFICVSRLRVVDDVTVEEKERRRRLWCVDGAHSGVALSRAERCTLCSAMSGGGNEATTQRGGGRKMRKQKTQKDGVLVIVCVGMMCVVELE